MITVDEIKEHLDRLSKIAKERMIDSTILIGHYCEIDFLTSEEREARHHLILSLPSFCEEREAARLRIKERISKRKLAKEARKLLMPCIGSNKEIYK